MQMLPWGAAVRRQGSASGGQAVLDAGDRETGNRQIVRRHVAGAGGCQLHSKPRRAGWSGLSAAVGECGRWLYISNESLNTAV